MTVCKALLIIFGIYSMEQRQLEREDAQANRDELQKERERQHYLDACDKLVERTGHGCGF